MYCGNSLKIQAIARTFFVDKEATCKSAVHILSHILDTIGDT